MPEYPARRNGDAPRLNPDFSRVPADVLRATHPIYDAYINRWLMYLDLYEADNLGRYVDRHERESASSHRARINRIQYRNFCGPVADLYTHYIFSKPIVRTSAAETGNTSLRKGATPIRKGNLRLVKGTGSSLRGPAQEWEAWLKNVDRRGSDIDRFMSDTARFAFVFGHMFVAVDMPTIAQAPRTEAERKKMHLQPYLCQYFPTEAVNWELDEDESLVWIRFRELAVNNQSPWEARTRDQYEAIQLLADPRLARKNTYYRTQSPGRARYRTWTRNEWVVHDIVGDQVKVVGQGTHDLGEVPVAVVYYRKLSRYPFIGQSLLSDIALLNKDIMNLDSLISEAIYQQTINILVMGRQPLQKKEEVLGPDNILYYTGDRAPYFISPSTAPVSFMEQRIVGLRDEIYRLAKLGGGLGLQPQSVPSGVAAAFEFNETNKMLTERADELQNAEALIQALWFRWMHQEPQGQVDYPDDFSVQSFQEQLQFVRDAKTSVRSPTFKREIEKQAVKHMLPHADEETLDRIIREIEVVADSIDSFSGPVYYDPITQEVKAPSQQQPGAVVGPLASLLAPEEQAQEQVPPEQGQQMPAQGADGGQAA